MSFKPTGKMVDGGHVVRLVNAGKPLAEAAMAFVQGLADGTLKLVNAKGEEQFAIALLICLATQEAVSEFADAGLTDEESKQRLDEFDAAKTPEAKAEITLRWGRLVSERVGVTVTEEMENEGRRVVVDLIRKNEAIDTAREALKRAGFKI